jgi:hypothetical protein
MGRPIFWSDFHRVVKARDLLLKLLGEQNGRRGSRSLLQKLNSVYALYADNRARLQALSLSRKDMERLIQNDRWRWLLVYSLSRESEGSGRRGDLAELQRMIIEDNLIEILNVAVRWAELLTRR